MKSINGKRILVIDDDNAILRALNKVLSGEGAKVTSACWAGEAMEHLTGKSESFDLIITDLRMPILGGQTILGAVTVALPDVPVMIMTAFGTPELETECLRQGAAAFLEKPLDAAQLLGAIQGVFSLSKPNPVPGARHSRGARKAGASVSDNQTEHLGANGGVVHGTGS